MKMLCDYCDKRNKCTKIISNERCLEFAHKLSFTEIDDSRDFYLLSNRMEWDYVNLDIHIIYFLSYIIIIERLCINIPITPLSTFYVVVTYIFDFTMFTNTHIIAYPLQEFNIFTTSSASSLFENQFISLISDSSNMYLFPKSLYAIISKGFEP